jgi:hypothetical protein
MPSPAPPGGPMATAPLSDMRAGSGGRSPRPPGSRSPPPPGSRSPPPPELELPAAPMGPAPVPLSDIMRRGGPCTGGSGTAPRPGSPAASLPPVRSRSRSASAACSRAAESGTPPAQPCGALLPCWSPVLRQCPSASAALPMLADSAARPTARSTSAVAPCTWPLRPPPQLAAAPSSRSPPGPPPTSALAAASPRICATTNASSMNLGASSASTCARRGSAGAGRGRQPS